MIWIYNLFATVVESKIMCLSSGITPAETKIGYIKGLRSWLADRHHMSRECMIQVATLHHMQRGRILGTVITSAFHGKCHWSQVDNFRCICCM